MKVALDTNLLVYSEGVNGTEKRDAARGLIDQLRGHELVLPVQVLGELFAVLVRKSGQSAADARALLRVWQGMATIHGTSAAILLSAADIAAEHGMYFWDALILATAASAGCDVLLTEDLHNGFMWGGVTVVNPFLVPPHPLLSVLGYS